VNTVMNLRGFRKRRKISLVSEPLLASEEGSCCMESVNYNIIVK
jgi:hypothetical protein